MTAGSVRLGEVQETLLATLYARAVESGKKHALLDDPMAVRMVAAIDYDFSVFDGSPMLFGSVLRTLILDGWVRAFLAGEGAEGTVVEIGAGLNTRFERVDNGRVNWVDLDLPDAMSLRRDFFAETDRRHLLPASLLDDSWVPVVRERPGPYLFIAEGVLLYFRQDQVREAVRRVAGHFPGSRFAFDTAATRFIAGQDAPIFRKRVQASLTWACDRPADLAAWGLRLRESRTLLDQPPEVRARLAPAHRLLLPAIRLLYRRQADAYRVNLFDQ